MYFNFGTSLIAGSYAGALPIMALGMAGVSVFIIFVLVVILVVSNWKLYQKAGQPGWASIIPLYNVYILLEMVKKPTWWLILYFIPIVNIAIAFIVYWELAKAFGKDLGYAIGLFFLPIIFIPILAFGEARYVFGGVAPASAPSNPTPTPTV